MFYGVFMKKQYYFLAAMILVIFSSVSSAATKSFYASGKDDNATHPEFLSKGESEKIEIDYKLGRNWVISSAKLWLRAVDDYNGGHCSASGFWSDNCKDVPKGDDSRNKGDNGHKADKYLDGSELALITIKGKGHNDDVQSKPLEIDNFKWYDLNLNVTKYLIQNGRENDFTATLKASLGDFWYKNAKIVVDYDIKAVPVPAAIWLFGSALFGLTGMKRKSAATAVAA
jgi:hypothetical protein